MKEYDHRQNDDRIQRTKDRINLIWRMEEEEEESDLQQENIQKKPSLEIGSPDDKYEQEADAVAKKVVSGDNTGKPGTFSDAPSKVQSKQEEPGMLMAKSKDGQLHGTGQLQSTLNSSKGSGASLDAQTQTEMSNKMGADLSDVKVHTDSKANEMAEGINAKAFTHGQDIYFNKGNFDTSSNQGKGLLAHELAHTQQQKNGLQRKIQRSLKFEIQTFNFLWQVDASGNPSYIERKLGNERGDVPTYISKGKRGVNARSTGDEFFTEAVGKTTMKNVRTNTMVEAKAPTVDESKPAQIVKIVLVKNLDMYLETKKIPDEKDIIVKDTLDRGGSIMLKTTKPKGTYNEGTTEFKYYDEDRYNKKLQNIGQDILNMPLPETRQWDQKKLQYDKAPLSGKKEEAPEEKTFNDTNFEDVHRNEQGAFEKGHKKFMIEQAPELDGDKKAQFQRQYKFNVPVTETDLIGERVVDGQLDLVHETDNAKDPAMAGLYNPNTFENRYFDDKGNELFIHLNSKREFRRGNIKLMTVGDRGRSDIVDDRPSQFIETWKVTVLPHDPNYTYGTDTVAYFDPVSNEDRFAKIEHITPLDVDNSKGTQPFNTGKYEKNYYLDTDFSGSTLNPGATLLNVHLSPDGGLIPPHVKSMEKIESKKAKEQTAIELQAEAHGVIEFETPKWFTNWEELRQRVQDAVDMTEAMNNAPVVTDTKLIKKMEAAKTKNDRAEYATAPLGTIHEWPASLSTNPQLNKTIGNKKLYVEIVYPDWYAFFQTSEGIPLSEVGSILSDPQVDDDFAIASDVKSYTDKIFDGAKKSSPVAGKDDTLFADLKGFLQLIISYIIWGQANESNGHKDTFPLMARTDFGSMYTTLLSEDEKELFKFMLTYIKDPALNTELLNRINTLRRNLGRTNLTVLNSSTQFFAGGHSGGDKRNPFLYDWLEGIAKGEDKLSGNQPNVADAIGGRKVNTEEGNKDYKQALFEKRYGLETIPNTQWIRHAKDRFTEAMGRTQDTPDDPTTTKEKVLENGVEVEKNVNEASKTSIKWK